MKTVLAFLLACFFMTSLAFAIDVNIPVRITFAAPLSVATVQGASIGTLVANIEQEIVTLDASSIASIAASNDEGAASAANELCSEAVLRRNNIEDDSVGTHQAGYVVLKSSGVDFEVRLIETSELSCTTTASNTPITVIGITTNALQVAGVDMGDKTFIPLFVGPILQIPANIEPGAYVGEISISLIIK